MTWLPDRSKLLIDLAGPKQRDIHILDAATGRSTPLLQYPEFRLTMPRLSPDGRTLVFSESREGRSARSTSRHSPASPSSRAGVQAAQAGQPAAALTHWSWFFASHPHPRSPYRSSLDQGPRVTTASPRSLASSAALAARALALSGRIGTIRATGLL